MYPSFFRGFSVISLPALKQLRQAGVQFRENLHFFSIVLFRRFSESNKHISKCAY